MRALREPWLRWLLLSAGAVALVAVGYALHPESPRARTTEVQQARAVVIEFARATDEDACDLLTEKALEKVYGGKRKCVERSARFEAGAVRIEKATVVEGRASVKATSLDGRTLFSVRLEKTSPGCDAGLPGNPWLIEQVTEQPNR